MLLIIKQYKTNEFSSYALLQIKNKETETDKNGTSLNKSPGS